MRKIIFSLLLMAMVPATATAKHSITVFRDYTLGYAPSSMCRTDSTIGGACFDIPIGHRGESLRHFFVVARDSLDYWAQFRVIALDAAGVPMLDWGIYGEFCADTLPLVAPEGATRLVVEIGEGPSFMVNWCPHVRDDGRIWVTFSDR